MNKIEHIGIAVKDLEIANDLYTVLLGTKPYKEEIVESEQVKTSFFKIGDSKIELLQGLNEKDAISTFIDKRGEGVHHIAFEVDDIIKAIKELKANGFHLINDKPKVGADNKLIAFVHPKSCHGVLIELCQENTPINKN